MPSTPDATPDAVPPLQPLHGHPRHTGGAALRLLAGASLQADGGLRLKYVLTGAPAHLRLPPPAAGERVDGLWRHTCCEAFLRRAGATVYREFNFSPSGAWAAYDFSAWRVRSDDPPAAVRPAIALQRFAAGLTLEVRLPPAAVPPAAGTADLELALTAVTEDADGTLRYWSLHHPAPEPDFHHPDGFVLRLPAPGRGMR